MFALNHSFQSILKKWPKPILIDIVVSESSTQALLMLSVSE